MSEEIVLSSEVSDNPPSKVAEAKIAIYKAKPSAELAHRLMALEDEAEGLHATIRALIEKEQSDVATAVEDRRAMAEKLGNLLKGNVSRSAFQRALEDASGLRRELAAMKRGDALYQELQQENVELKRRIEVLELRLGGREGEALAREKGYAALRDVERGEGAAIDRARARRVNVGAEMPEEDE